MRIHIVARDIVQHDAIGEFCLALGALDSIGYTTHYWAENTDLPFVRDISKLEMFCAKGDLIFYNYSIYDPWLPTISNLQLKKIFYYHGITPVQYVDDIPTKQLCDLGLKNIVLATYFDKVIASSELTKDDFRIHGLQRDISLFPPYISGEEIILGSTNKCNKLESLLYCGRLAKHKHVDELVTWYSNVRTLYGFKSLTIISKDPNCLKIADELLSIKAFCNVPNSELLKYINSTDAFVTFSAHEGFCVPAYLAARNGKPVLVNKTDCFSQISYYTVIDCNNLSFPLIINRPDSFTIHDFAKHVLF